MSYNRKNFHSKYFSFQQRKYKYFDHPYNTTKLNERAVEIPIILEELKQARGKNVLEIGNVLSHYVSIHHDVVDKYEIAPGVKNEDILLYEPKNKYDLIISISTLEHVGWDEFPRDKNKIRKTLSHLSSMLAQNGRLIFTVPVAINDYLDVMLHEHTLLLSHMFCLKRVHKNNIWEEKSWEQIRYCLYDTPFPNANGIVVGVIDKINAYNQEEKYRILSLRRIMNLFSRLTLFFCLVIVLGACIPSNINTEVEGANSSPNEMATSQMN